ncbi:hypothetical protein BpHYR1_023213 [Brachionus plicatilis]|uniref:Uncharacterized protein n=1 Tax=Brachionus plicatilis TaxID=10195 RepID=A0A3M7PNQ6_BRAPC|nr:hypothetical protein BpHYR1_023213 [Brachionus plicatilis]
MKFKISKTKLSVPNKGTDLNDKYQTSRIPNLNQEIESKSANMLFSLKSKTKMKRSHQKMNGIAINTVIACQNDKDQDAQKSSRANYEKNVKKVNLKQFGATFANLFKPKKQNYIESNEKLKIENENIFFPVPIRFETNKRESGFGSVSNDTKNSERVNQARKTHPSMGLKAYNLKAKLNPSKTDEIVENDFACSDPKPKLYKNKSEMFDIVPNSVIQNELNAFQSDSNLKRDFENQELYDCLVNYESHQLYRNVANELKTLSDGTQLNLNSANVAPHSNNLTPFLDETRESYNPQPLFSSTAADFDSDLGEFKLPITPLKNVSNMSRMKKLRSFSNLNIDN